MFQPRVILHPTDYSDCARGAFEVAIDVAIRHKARLLVLHVEDTLGPELVSYGEATNEQQPAGHLARLRQELVQNVPPRPDLPIEHLLAEGDPGTVIVATAQQHQCDLIVMGTYGRSPLSQLLTGSVTRKVQQLATCATLTVHMPAAPAE